MSETEDCSETSSTSPLPSFASEDDSGAAIAAAANAMSNKKESNIYRYRDFGLVEDDDDSAALQGLGVVDDEQSTHSGTTGSTTENSSIRVQKFPVKLYAILAQPEFAEIISWMPHGRCWKVNRPSMFESLVMPLFFEYSNYHSFNRLVNAWSFRRVSTGPDRGAYYHEVRMRNVKRDCFNIISNVFIPL
jgi:HSF-type DNA-binding